MAIVKAKRLDTLIRIGLTGPTNAGKTLTALYLAFGMAKEQFPNLSDDELWEKIAILDTERNRALTYADRTDLPFQTGSFWHLSIEAPYTPAKYIAAIKEAESTVGPKGIIIIDSMSHAWAYQGGVLDIHNEASKNKNSFTSWNDAGKIQNSFVDAVMSSKAHTISTIRSKMDYVLEQNNEGKQVPTKVGLKPVQRDDLEYEFDITLMLNKNHVPTIIKDTTFLETLGLDEPITPELGAQLIRWYAQGTDQSVFIEEKRKANIDLIKKYASEKPELRAFYDSLPIHNGKKEITHPDNLSLEETKTVLEEFTEVLK